MLDAASSAELLFPCDRANVIKRRLLREAYIMAYNRLATLSAITALLFSLPAYAQSRPGDGELAQMLRAGGYVIVLRHGATHADQADTDPLNHDNLAKQRQLNAKGEEAAKALGEAFKLISAPVSRAITSHFNRAYQTAKLAGFDNVEKSIDVTEGGLVVSPNENNRRAAAFRKLASTVPPAGTNVLIVSHKPNIIDAFGKDWFEVKEGEATIFKPDGTAYQVVARIQIDEWPRIAAAARK
jgi:phosphohistidine phosphatase SixA